MARNVVSHFSVGTAVSIHLNSFAILRHGDKEGTELASSVLVKIELDMELFLSVNLELSSWTVVVVTKLVNVVLPARSRSIAIVVESVVWSIARVSSCLPSPLVSFHDIELRAIVTTNLVTIAVVVPICVPEVTILAFPWHTDQVDGSNASAVSGAEINVILNTSAK